MQGMFGLCRVWLAFAFSSLAAPLPKWVTAIVEGNRNLPSSVLRLEEEWEIPFHGDEIQTHEPTTESSELRHMYTRLLDLGTGVALDYGSQSADKYNPWPKFPLACAPIWFCKNAASCPGELPGCAPWYRSLRFLPAFSTFPTFSQVNTVA